MSGTARSAVVLLSGGLDSAVTLAIAREGGYAAHALTVDYGQRQRAELRAAGAVARALGAVTHTVVKADLRAIGGSALTDDAIEVPKGRDEAAIQACVPVTYVPMRNLVLLSLAASLAEARGAWDVFIGVNAIDYSGYPDCRAEFLEAFAPAANLGSKAREEAARRGVREVPRLRVHAPLLRLTKARIIARGAALGVDPAMTVSCYDPAEDGGACGACDACVLRRRGFAEAGMADPTRYRAPPGAEGAR